MADIELSMDGPHSPERTREVALLAAECVRYLDHATMPGQDGLEYPADAERLLGDLGTAVERLPQLFAQVSHFLAGQVASGRVGGDRGCNPHDLTADAVSFLHQAGSYANDLASVLRHARSATSGLYVKEDTDG